MESDLLFPLKTPQLRVQHEHDRSHLCDPGLQGRGGAQDLGIHFAIPAQR